MTMQSTNITGQIEGCSFPQWYLEQGNADGIWTPEEVTVVSEVLRKAMQDYYDQGFGYATNYWRVWKSVWPEHTTQTHLFTAVKATWEFGSYGAETAGEIATKIEQYYSRK